MFSGDAASSSSENESDYNRIKKKCTPIDHIQVRCNECKKPYSNVGNFVKHFREAHLSNIVKIPCPECKKTFTKMGNMRRHLKNIHDQKDPKQSVFPAKSRPPKEG